MCEFRKIWYTPLKLSADVISSVPIYQILMRKGGYVFGLVLIAMFGRLWRLQRVKKFINRFVRKHTTLKYFFGRNHTLNYFFVRTVEVLLVAMFFTHWSVCFFYALADRRSSQRKSWINQSFKEFRVKSIWFQYITSVYWPVTTVSTVGYGELHLWNLVEMLYVIANILVNFGLQAYIMANVTMLVLEWSKCTMEFQSVMKAVDSYLKNLSPELRKQINEIAYVRYEQDLVNEQSYLQNVQHAYLFRGVPIDIIKAMVANMEPESYKRGEDVIRGFEPSKYIYYILEGAITIIGPVAQVTPIRPLHGCIFGEITIIISKNMGLTYRATIDSKLLRLKCSKFIKIMEMSESSHLCILGNFYENYATHHRDIISVPKNRNPYLDVWAATRMGNSDFLDRFFTAGGNPNLRDDDNRRTPMHITASEGNKGCVLVLLKHNCDVHARDAAGDIALWEVVRRKHPHIFQIIFQKVALTNPFVAGELLCLAVERDDATVMKELLDLNLPVDSKSYQGSTALQIALKRNKEHML